MARAKQKTASAGQKRKRKPAKSTKVRAKANKVVALELSDTANPAEVDTGPEEFAERAAAAPSAESDSQALMLPDCLDSAAVTTVRDLLLARRGNAIVIDASQVRRVGAQSLQVLIAAARTWQADGHSYRVTNSSPELLDTIALIGLAHEDLLLEGSSQ
jgi:anti-anti-sigma regulatory factor